MDTTTKQALIDELVKASTTNHPVTIKHRGKPVTIFPVEDQKKFQVERDQKLEMLKVELTNILVFIRSRIKPQHPEELEAQLAAFRHYLEQDMNNLDDTL